MTELIIEKIKEANAEGHTISFRFEIPHNNVDFLSVWANHNGSRLSIRISPNQVYIDGVLFNFQYDLYNPNYDPETDLNWLMWRLCSWDKFGVL